MALAGVIEALSAIADLPADTAVTLHFADPALAAELAAADGAPGLWPSPRPGPRPAAWWPRGRS